MGEFIKLVSTEVIGNIITYVITRYVLGPFLSYAMKHWSSWLMPTALNELITIVAVSLAFIAGVITYAMVERRRTIVIDEDNTVIKL